MTKLEIPEGDFNAPWEIHEENGGGYMIDDGACGFVCRVDSKRRAQLIALAPAMAEEIRRLRERIQRLSAEAESHHVAYVKEVQMRMALEEEKATLCQGTATREDRAFQCLQGLLANPNVVGHNHNHGWGLVNCDEKQLGAFCGNLTDNVLAALAKPQGAGEPKKEAELKGLLKIAYGIMGCHHEYSVATGWKSNTCPVCSDGQHTENIRKIQVALGYFKDEPEKPVTRRPFNLEAALRGEKVVTRYGRHVTNLRRNHGHQDDYALIGEVEGVGVMHWRENGRHGYIHDSDADLFMEGGV